MFSQLSRLLPATTLALTLLTLAVSCTPRGGDTVPKPEGWPRIEVPAEHYTDHRFQSVSLQLNSSAAVSARDKDGATWIDISYPSFDGSHIYLTLTPATSLEALAETLDNRRERMELNSGGAVTELTGLTSDGGWECTMTVTRSSLTTPVQIIANDGRNVLSGALYLNFAPGTPADSVSPIVSTVRRDLIHALKHVRTL